jgi:RNA polymerase sigma factor (sigma-70 family)
MGYQPTQYKPKQYKPKQYKPKQYQHSQGANLAVAEVVAAAAGGDEQAWDELYRRYHRMIAGVAHTWGCAAADLPDVEQAVWARLVVNIGRLRQPDAIAGWLAVVTRRECTRLGSSRPHTVQVDEETAPLPTVDDEPLVTVLHAERRAAVRRAVATLPARRRTLLETMLDHPDEDYDQLAVRLSMPVGSIGPTRRRGLDELRGHRELGAWRLRAQTA